MTAIKHRRKQRPVEVQKIDHITVLQPVDDIAHGTPQNAGEGKRKQLLIRMAQQLPGDEAAHHHANGGEQPALPAPG